MWIQMGTEHCLKRTDKRKMESSSLTFYRPSFYPPSPDWRDLVSFVLPYMKNILYLRSFLLFSEAWCCSCFFLMTGEPEAMAKLKTFFMPQPFCAPDLTDMQHGTVESLDWTPIAAAFSSVLSSFCEETSWKSDVISPVYLKVASTWFVMIRSSSGKKGTNKWEMEKWVFANWYAVERNELKENYVQSKPGDSVLPPFWTDKNFSRWMNMVWKEGEECVWTSRRGIIGHRFWVGPISVKMHLQGCFSS